jgi:ABC-2 type transport system permease protein
VTIFSLALRQLLTGKRWLALCALAAVPILLSWFDRMGDTENAFLQEGFPEIVIGVIVPMLTLLLAGSVFASDMEEGTASIVLSKPISRMTILLERFAATVLLALALTLGSSLLSILVQWGRAANLGSLMLAATAAVAVGTIVYAALFIALSLVTRRGIIIGLLYVLIWESTLAGQFAGTRSLSVREYMFTILSALDRTGLAQQITAVTPRTALLLGLVVLSLALGFALLRLKNYEVTEQG